MLWRALPSTLQRSFLGLGILTATATLCTVIFEAAWYGLVNGIDPGRILLANLDPELDLPAIP